MLTIALGQVSEGKWYVSTRELQLASFEVCVICRGVRTLRVTVDKRMPHSLWGDDNSLGGSINAPERRRLPALRAAGVAWVIPAGMLVPVLSEAALLREAAWMQLTGVDCRQLGSKGAALSRWDDSILLPGSALVHSPRSYFEAMLPLFGQEDLAINNMQIMGSLSWPSALRQLSLGCLWHERVDWAALPSSLERLALGGNFNQPVEWTAWPVELKHLTLGGRFNQPVVDVVWPTSLLKLTFGNNFNQLITNVVWPDSLLELGLGDRYNEPITDVAWPAFLLELTFGNDFDQPITNVAWPDFLLGLTFGNCFNKSITDVIWPDSLNRLQFGDVFNQPITEVVWPIALESLVFGREFDQPVERCVWPAPLQCLVFSDSFFFSQAKGIEWPPSLESLIFRNYFVEDEGPGWPPRQDLFENPYILRVQDI